MIRREWNEKRRSVCRRAVSRFMIGVMSALVVGTVFSVVPDIPATVSYAEEQESWSGNSTSTVNRTSDRPITDDDRADADEDMLYYMQSLEVRYKLDEKVMENLHKVFDSAVYYIANTEMSLTELWAYVSQTKSNMESTAVAAVTMTT